MDETKNEQVEVEESLDLPTVAEDQEDTTDWKAEAQKLRDKAIGQRERTKALKAELASTKKAVELAVGSKKEASQPKTGELDETQLDYLDLKGISDSEDIKLIEDTMRNSGKSLREVLKLKYVITEMEANKAQREVKDATPSSTKRAGPSQTNDLATAIAKYEQAGFDPDTLPTDFTLRSAVINAITDRTSPNKPAWHG